MRKFKISRMQRLPSETSQHRDQVLSGAFGQRETTPVNRITDQRVASMREVHTNLVRTTRVQFDAYISMRGESLQYRVVRYGGLAVFAHAYAFAVNPMPAQWLIDRSATGEDSVANSKVMARYFAIGQLPDQRSVRNQGLGDYEQAGCVFVNAMHDTGARQLLEFGRMMQQSVH